MISYGAHWEVGTWCGVTFGIYDGGARAVIGTGTACWRLEVIVDLREGKMLKSSEIKMFYALMVSRDFIIVKSYQSSYHHG